MLDSVKVDGVELNRSAKTEELLRALLVVQNKSCQLDEDELVTIKRWLLVKAKMMEPGQQLDCASNDNPGSVSIGRTDEGVPYVRDMRGCWP